MIYFDKGLPGHRAVFGIFHSREEVENCVDTLKVRGFRGEDISVLMPSIQSSKEFSEEKSTKAPEGAAAGASSGLVLGGALGWLVGAGALAIPGIGPFVAAGPILASIAGAGIGGTVGGITGALIGYGIPEHEAKRYENRVQEGGILISVHVDDSMWGAKARMTLEDCGANDISTTLEEDPGVRGYSAVDHQPRF